MNKTAFIKKLSEEANISIERATAIDNVLEEVPIVGKTNKEKIIHTLEETLDVTYEEAENYYEIASRIIISAIKNKIVHPFKKQG